jgi:hypothetical protein
MIAAIGLFAVAPAQAQTCRSSFASGLFTAGITDIQRELAARLTSRTGGREARAADMPSHHRLSA